MNAAAQQTARPANQTLPPQPRQAQAVYVTENKMPNVYVIFGVIGFTLLCALLTICFNNVTDSIKSVGTDSKSAIQEIRTDVKSISNKQDKMAEQQSDMKSTLAGMDATMKSIDQRTNTNTNSINEIQSRARGAP